MNIKVWLRGIVAPRPSLFDFAICGILALPWIHNPFYQGTYFIFYSVFLLCLSFGMKPKREYKSIPLCVLLMWALIGVFARHPVNVVSHTIVNYYFNVAIFFEGFIYLLFGIILLTTIIRYSTNIKFLWMLLPVSAFPILKQLGHEGNITIIASLALAYIIYLIIKEKPLGAYLISLCSLILVFIKWKWICLKWVSRPLMWKELLREIKHHPWFGIGFNDTFSPDNMITLHQNGTVYGYTFRHNDILSIGSYLGVIVFLAVIWFCYESLKQIKGSVYLISFLTILLMCNFKMTFFYPERAGLCLVVMAICLKNTMKEELT